MKYISIKTFFILLFLFALFTINCGYGELEPWGSYSGSNIGTSGWSNAVAGKHYVANEVIIKAEEEYDAYEIAKKANGTLISQFAKFDGFQYIKVHIGNQKVMDVIQNLKDDTTIAYVQPNFLYQKMATYCGDDPNNSNNASFPANDPMYTRPTTPDQEGYGYEWGPKKVQMDKAWCITQGHESVLITVIDTGIKGTHEEFDGRMVEGRGYYGIQGMGNDVNQPINPPDVIPPRADSDGDIHGTHCAGLTCATGNNAKGGANGAILGSADIHGNTGCKLNIHRVFPAGAGGAADDPILRAIIDAGNYIDRSLKDQYDISRPIQRVVMNMSLGGRFWDQGQMDAAYYASRLGGAIMAAAGNDSVEFWGFPAGYPGVIAVGATDGMDRPAFFTSKGMFVSISSPGVNMWSTFAKGSQSDWINLSGTSMATPFAVGIAALALSAAIDPNVNALGVGSRLSVSALRTILENSSVDLGEPGYDTTFGWGRVNALGAVRLARDWDNARDNKSPKCKYGAVWLELVELSSLSGIETQLNNIEVLLFNSKGILLTQARTMVKTFSHYSTIQTSQSAFLPKGAYFFHVPVGGLDNNGNRETYSAVFTFKGVKHTVTFQAEPNCGSLTGDFKLDSDWQHVKYAVNTVS